MPVVVIVAGCLRSTEGCKLGDMKVRKERDTVEPEAELG